MNLGYCVVFSHGEQGMEMIDVIATGIDLERSFGIVESITGYPRDHERYPPKVFDLTKIQHMAQLGMEEATHLLGQVSDFSPESVDAISCGKPVVFTVQAYHHLGARTWINRRWGAVTKFLRDHLNKSAMNTKEYAAKQREFRKNKEGAEVNKNDRGEK